MNANSVMELETPAVEAGTRKIRAVFIDALNKKVSDVEIEPTLDEFYKRIGCRLVTVALRFPNGDVLYVDDEGLLKGPTHYFRVPGYDNWLAGNGLILGTDDTGDEADAQTRAEYLGMFYMEITSVAPAADRQETEE